MKKINQNRSASQGDRGKVTWAQVVTEGLRMCGQSTAAEMLRIVNELAEAAHAKGLGSTALACLASA